jgi:hypothetical protein
MGRGYRSNRGQWLAAIGVGLAAVAVGLGAVKANGLSGIAFTAANTDDAPVLLRHEVERRLGDRYRILEQRHEQQLQRSGSFPRFDYGPPLPLRESGEDEELKSRTDPLGGAQ